MERWSNYMAYTGTNPFSVSFTAMKLRYHDYDNSIESLNFLNPTDKVNVFINFESVLNNLSMMRDIDTKLLLERKFPTIFESEMINLCAHYKKFFRGNGLDTKVFLYYTDLSSPDFINYKYNDEYRSYYINKYLQNPKFQLLGNKLLDVIIPRVQKISEFIPNVYFINAPRIDGSLVPFIISKEYPDSKNFIISTDKYDTQYLLYRDKFCVHYIKRSSSGSGVFCNFEKYISDLFKENYEENNESSLFLNPSFYSLLLSSLGDKPRSLEPLKGIGVKTVMKYLSSGINDGLFTKQSGSIDMILKTFPEDQEERANENFHCFNIEKQYSDLTQKEIFQITNQIVDRSDFTSLIQLNNEDYRDYPLMLPELTS